jgi:DNA-binding NtrC family response regulator
LNPASLKRILVIDDEPQVLALLRELLQAAGWDVHTADSGTAGIERIERNRFDVVLTDLKMPGADGIEVLRTARKIQSDAEVVLMTAYGSVDSAVEAMRAGAFHYLTKPFMAEEVIHLVDRAYAQRQLRRENLFLKAESRGSYQLHAVVGTSAALQEVVASMQRLADTDTPVLLAGERGTGRGFFARIIHFHSAKANGLFVPVYCSGAEEEALENELFGHAAGAYERAVLPRPGKMELADHGTLYLSGIEDAPPKTQERLRRFLATRTAAPVGGSQEVVLDVRIVASCQADPDLLVDRGKLLPELRDAFAPGLISVPPLRERPEDIPLLLHQFLFEANRGRKKPLRGFSGTALEVLASYPWPGNVRELVDIVRSVAAKKKQGTIVDAADLPPDFLHGRRRARDVKEAAPVRQPSDIRDAIEDLERPMVLQALALADGDRERAARLLHVDVATLEELMRRHAIER